MMASLVSHHLYKKSLDAPIPSKFQTSTMKAYDEHGLANNFAKSIEPTLIGWFDGKIDRNWFLISKIDF